MTAITTPRLTDPIVIGPFSHWPRRTQPLARVALFAGGVAGIGVFLHCVTPLLIAA